MSKIVLLIFTGIIFFSCKQSTSSKKGDMIYVAKDSLVLELMQLHKQGFINGFSAAIVNENEILFKTGIGYSNVKTKEEYSENTIQNIGSISKTFIGIALLKAQQLGKLNLDDPINKYLPYRVRNPYHPKEEITIRQLAAHTSTILDTKFYNKSYVLEQGEEKLDSIAVSLLGEDMNTADSKTSMKKFLYETLNPTGEFYTLSGFSKYKPGELFQYSNIGATLAAEILEIATNQSFDEFTRKYILKPLKMDTSGWSFNTIAIENHSNLYLGPNKRLPLYSLITYPDGGFLTNINDLGTYLIELINGYDGKGSLLSNDSYRQLFKPQLSSKNFINQDELDSYGDEHNYGIFMSYAKSGEIGHSGSDPGIKTYMFFNPDSKIGRILVINTELITPKAMEEFDAIWAILQKYENKFIKSNQ